MINVLLTTIPVRSGLTTHVWDLAKYLPLHGINVSVAVMRGYFNGAPPDEAFLGVLESRFKGCPFVYYNSVSELAAFAKKQKVHVIHAHSRITFSSSLETATKLEKPLVVTLHGVAPWQRLSPRTLESADRIIAIGPEEAESAGSQWENKISVIYNGIDTAQFRPGQIEADEAGPLRILWFGRTHGLASRGLQALDQAVGILLGEGKSIQARMVGKAEAEVENIECCGWVDDPLPHLQWGQIAFGHCRALREAMACGNAGFLIGFGYGGSVHRDWFITAGNFALSATPQYTYPLPEPGVIASDLLKVYTDRQLLYEMRRDARATALEYFDVRNMVAETAGVYGMVLRR